MSKTKKSGYATKCCNVALILLACLILRFGMTSASQATSQDKTDTYRQLELFGDVFERVRNDYVEEISDEELIEAAIEGMLGHLDPHSSFLNKKKLKEMKVQTRGEFGGLGIEVTMDRESGLVKVVSPIDDTPAFRAGLMAGDLISHLDGKPVRGLSLSQAVERMRGSVNTDLILTIRRAAQKPFDVTLTRARIRIQSVRSRTEGKVGYVRITSFNEQSTKGLQKALKKLKKEIGAEVKGYVLDLRNNPGGLLDQAVSVTDVFLNQGEIVSTRGRHKESAQRFQATKGDSTDGLPLVVLINGGSASASEIVAGALQDHRRAIILGTSSFGKGSVQTIIPLGQSGAIKMTTQRYYTPSGRSIQAKGIDPDIRVQQAKLEFIEQPGRRSEASLRNSLKNENDPRKNKEPKGEKDRKSENLADVKKEDKSAKKTSLINKSLQDYQLERALGLLRGLSLFQQTKAGETN